MTNALEEPTAPKNEHGGLNVVDFPRQSVLESVRKSIGMLLPGKRRLLYVAAGIQISLGILDLVGIALIGLLAAVAVSGIGLNDLPTWTTRALDFLGLGSFTVIQLSVILAVASVTILVLKTVVSAFLNRRIILFLARRQADLSSSLARDFLSQTLSVIQRWTTSEATYALGSGAAAATVTLLGSAIAIASESFLLAIVGVALFVYDPLLTATSAIFFGLVVYFLHRVLGKWTAQNAQTVTVTSIDTLTAVSEALSTYREATVLNRRDLYIARYENLVGTYARASSSNSFLVEIPKYALEIALYLGVLIMGAVQFLTKDWAAAAATVAIFLAAGSRIIPSLLRLQGAGISIRNASVSAQPTYFMFDFLNSHESSPDESRNQLVRVTVKEIHEQVLAGFPDFFPTISLSHASLTYPEADRPALIGASFNVLAGRSIALVGPTGAGKSTLADIILGVLQPDSGTVLVGGLTPREAINRWPGGIAYVPQSVALVEGNVRQNVALGIPESEALDDLIWEALERAHLADYLRSQREGLETRIGERGFKLSGGQRQRLGIARALYTRPKLLVLDEATSALDAETERAIIQTLGELEGAVTTVTVAHRLATVRQVDQLLYLEHGQIVSMGTFDQVRNSIKDLDRQAKLLGL